MGLRYVLPLLPVLFFGGCDKKAIYSQFCTEETHRIDCLKPVDALSDTVLEKYLPGVADGACPYRFKVSHYRVESCNNPKAKALGADFDGYVRMEIFDDEGCYYRLQQDFKSSSWESALPDLTRHLKTELLVP